MNKHYGLLHIPDTTLDETALPAWYAASDVDALIAELEKALRYWIADESLVTQEHQAAWGEHVKLLSSSLLCRRADSGTGSLEKTYANNDNVQR